MPSLNDYVAKVASGVEATRSQFKEFYRPGVTRHAIPFFGNVEAAKILTVGLNPSADEFVGRRWPNALSPSALTERLRGYFDSASPTPHPWFETWSAALIHLGLSYRNGGGVAYLDLSPRATASRHPDWKGFERLMEHDARWFFQILPLCHNARALLIAGAVTKREYINEFIGRIAPSYGHRLTGEWRRTPGSGKVGFHRLVGPACDLPVFFCSVSPSGREKSLLIDRVQRHRATILAWLQ